MVFQQTSELKVALSFHWVSNSRPIHEVRHPRLFSTRDRNRNDPCCSAGCRKQYPTEDEISKRRSFFFPLCSELTALEQMRGDEVAVLNAFV